MIWIRTDGNSIIGTGHIMRCLSLAAQLTAAGEEVCFLLADGSPISILDDRKQPYMILNSDYANLEGEMDQLLSLLNKEAPSLLLIDSYFVTESYLRKLTSVVCTAYIDDKYLFAYPVDILINYNIYGNNTEYIKMGISGETKMYMGAGYTPLREEFQNVSYEVRPQVNQVLITTGGADKYNLAGKILETVLDTDFGKQLQYEVVSGPFNKHLQKLKELAVEYKNIHIHQNVKYMSELMKSCDVAITAGGSTMYELCAIGVPILSFSFVDNQERIVQTFARKQVTFYGGDYLILKEAMLTELMEHLDQFIQDRKLRQEYSKREKAVVDGLGAKRLALALCREP